MKLLFLGVALVLGTVSLSAPTWAMELDYGVSCLKQDELRLYLNRAFQEARIAEGALENGHRIEFFAARDGSWTMVELTSDGYGCIHSYGHGLRVERGNESKRPAS